MSNSLTIKSLASCVHHARKLSAVLVLLGVTTSLLSPCALSAAISQGYHTQESITDGALVSLQDAKGDIAEADTTNGNQLLGVAINSTDSVLSINNSPTSVQVATSGTTQVFVSDLNGPIQPGDQIAASPIRGVGMKATGSGKVVGVAQTGFDGSGDVKTTSLTAANGATKSAHVGTISVVVQIAFYNPPNNTVVPAFLQSLAHSVTGKTVSVAQLVVASVVLGAAILVVALLMFASVRGAIVSIGRNPLAKSSIYRSMFQATATAVIVLAAAVAGSYMILRY